MYMNFTIDETILSNSTEMFRMFKFDQRKSFDEVDKGFQNANKTMIAKALNSAVEVRSIKNQVSLKKRF